MLISEPQNGYKTTESMFCPTAFQRLITRPPNCPGTSLPAPSLAAQARAAPFRRPPSPPPPSKPPCSAGSRAAPPCPAPHRNESGRAVRPAPPRRASSRPPRVREPQRLRRMVSWAAAGVRTNLSSASHY